MINITNLMKNMKLPSQETKQTLRGINTKREFTAKLLKAKDKEKILNERK